MKVIHFLILVLTPLISVHIIRYHICNSYDPNETFYENISYQMFVDALNQGVYSKYSTTTFNGINYRSIFIDFKNKSIVSEMTISKMYSQIKSMGIKFSSDSDSYHTIIMDFNHQRTLDKLQNCHSNIIQYFN